VCPVSIMLAVASFGVARTGELTSTIGEPGGQHENRARKVPKSGHGSETDRCGHRVRQLASTLVSKSRVDTPFENPHSGRTATIATRLVASTGCRCWRTSLRCAFTPETRYAGSAPSCSIAAMRSPLASGQHTRLMFYYRNFYRSRLHETTCYTT